MKSYWDFLKNFRRSLGEVSLRFLLRISGESQEESLETSLENLKRLSREIPEKSQWDIDMGYHLVVEDAYKLGLKLIYIHHKFKNQILNINFSKPITRNGPINQRILLDNSTGHGVQ
jgi:hypothetical protein